MRCSKCNKKSLFEYECRCLKKFCLNCLPYFNHSCQFDYKKQRMDYIKDENPLIILAKVEKI
jgi:hypothetical protein